MRITILGHASLFFEAGNEKVLLDPVLRTTPLMGALVHEYPRALDLAKMPRPTLIAITHAHFDHFDPETLAMLPKDVPVMLPTDRRMGRQLEAAGFTDLRRLGTWETLEHGALRFVATPSDAPVVEFGVLAEADGARLWHMSDAEAGPDVAARILAERGPVDVVTTKFQPADPQLNYQHNMGSSFDRAAVASWLETACACAPKLAFPYASGLCFDEIHAWLNRFAYPFSAGHVARLLEQRLEGVGSAVVVRPGDVLTIEAGNVTLAKQASPFVCQARPEADSTWEPFDDAGLVGFASADQKQAFDDEAARVLLGTDFADWLRKHASVETGLLRAFREWKVLAQLVLHLGAGERSQYLIDFRGDQPKVSRGRDEAANYFTHVGGKVAQALLAGTASPLEAMIGGSVRIYERIIAVRDGKLAAPTTARVYETFPDPFVSFGGMRQRG